MNTPKTKDLSQFNQDHLRDKLYSKTERSSKDQCWNWTGTLSNKGYGMIGIKTDKLRFILAHRASYHLNVGPIPNGALVCHTCDNRACVNPAHLFIGSHQDNMDDMVQKNRQCRGTKSPKALLSEELVTQIREHWAGRLTQTKLAQQLGVSISTVHCALYGKSWKHVGTLKAIRKKADKG